LNVSVRAVVPAVVFFTTPLTFQTKERVTASVVSASDRVAVAVRESFVCGA
jgi:hypothetical protein